MRGLVAAVCLLAPAIALADATSSSSQLEVEGEQLAREQRYTEAIDKFKAADRIEPRASHACLIALAYSRRELWAQAEIFFEKCQRMATAEDRLPVWWNDAAVQFAARLASANVAPVEIAVVPAGATVDLTISSFAPDETFTPRTIHLAPGRHVIIATAAGRRYEHVIEVADTTPQHVVIDVSEHVDAPRAVAPIVANHAPYYLMAGGLALAAVGGVLDATYYRSKRDALVGVDLQQYMNAEHAYDHARELVVGLYVAGGAVVIAGVIWRVLRPDESVPAIAIAPTSGGGLLSATWRR